MSLGSTSCLSPTEIKLCEKTTHTNTHAAQRSKRKRWILNTHPHRKTYTNHLGDKRRDCENYKWDLSRAQQPQLEINKNLLATIFFFKPEDGIWMKKVCVWPWKLIKNRCSDNHMEVMEALCICAPYILCVCVWVWEVCASAAIDCWS